MRKFSERQITFFFGALLVVIGAYSFLSNDQFDYLSRTSRLDWERLLAVHGECAPVEISFGKLVGDTATQEIIIKPMHLPRAFEFPGIITLEIDSIKSNENRELFDAGKEANTFQKLRFQKHVSEEIKASTIVSLLPLKEGEVPQSISAKVNFNVPIDVQKFEITPLMANKFIPTKELALQFLGFEGGEANLRLDLARCLNQPNLSANPSGPKIGCEDLNKIFKVTGVGAAGEVATYKGMSSANGNLKYKFDRGLSRLTLFVAKNFEQFNVPLSAAHSIRN